jgi:rhomboid family GlyGly-CTERM serine protease
MKPAGAAWAALAAGLALASVGVALGDGRASAALIDWRPPVAFAEPWRAWSAALVHLSPQHLNANLAGALVLGFLGWRAAVPRWAVIAWFVAWPLTQFGLLLRPELAVYGGLSGVLHAGVAVAAVHLLVDGQGDDHQRGRRIGAALLAGLVLKIAFEQPFGPVLRDAASAGIAVAPFAHFTGAVAGLLCAGLARVAASMQPR